MNIIFLDVDGVLNSLDYAKKLYETDKVARSCYDFPFDPRCLSNLKYLVDITNSYLVITSTWRMHEIGKEILISELRKYNLDDRVIGYTSILHKERGEEVKDYLDKLGKEVNYIILDDDSDFTGLEEYLIKTNFHVGLTEENVTDAVKKLVK